MHKISSSTYILRRVNKVSGYKVEHYLQEMNGIFVDD